ncbi:hypothetical protein [Caulobacter sp. BE254]|uniref:hypothetical protein n=1 Tax=Caulobacter sp. BE254 TaxID=2817720 RepID=UPI002863EFD4|nr:hypothetical protein [Caulobacter sp. BE254]MDR7118954.1 hypothetical protein [Caulobacter sp. BE254]
MTSAIAERFPTMGWIVIPRYTTARSCRLTSAFAERVVDVLRAVAMTGIMA